MIIETDFIIKVNKSGKKDKTFRLRCNQCGADRGYHRKREDVRVCASCKVSNQVGITMAPFTEEHKLKISKSKLGKKLPSERVIKSVCTQRGISVKEFNGFITPQNTSDRSKIRRIGLSQKCFERDNYTCQVCRVRGSKLNAHHLNSFSHFIEQRFELTNLVTLCKGCHKSFHKICGNGKIMPNTKEQYLEFKDKLCG
jgi:5-methylcytosine-specific restriction endonuclease McrA